MFPLRKILIVLVGCWLGMASVSAFSQPVVKVLALFSGRAMLEVDGQQGLFKVGDDVRYGVRLLSADQHEAVLELEGRREVVLLSDAIGGAYAEPQRPATRVWPDAQGMYLIEGKINNQKQRFLLDTGASDVALSAVQAKALGLDYLKDGVPVGVHTASATERGYRLMLDEVSVGPVKLRRVSAIVFEGAYPVVPLLGMSFLSRVELAREGEAMVVRGR